MAFTSKLQDTQSLREWLNEAALTQNNGEKVDLLRKIQEVLLRKSPALLYDFLPEVLNFGTEKSGDVKKALVGFIEEACKLDEKVLTKIMLNLHMLLCDECIAVQKRVIQATITVYRIMLKCISKTLVVSEELKQAWSSLCQIKMEIANMIDSDNDGVRTSSAKFLECVVLLQSYCDPNEPKTKNDFSLDDMPTAQKLVKRIKLEDEADNIFAILVKFNGSPHISSANLFVCIGVLTNIAKSRPEYMGQVVAALEALYANLPPTLSTTQVNSMRKKLKSELSSLIRHPAAQEYSESITAKLVELGCSQSEIAKMIPKKDDKRKYNKRTIPPTETTVAKRPRLDLDSPTQHLVTKALDANRAFIAANLDNHTAVQLVMKALYRVPDKMPTAFPTDYAESAELELTGGDDKTEDGGDTTVAGEKRIVVELLAEQFVEGGVGPGVKYVGKTDMGERRRAIKRRKEIEEEEEEEEVVVAAAEKMEVVQEKEAASSVTLEKVDKEEKIPKKVKPKPPKVKTIKLAEITKPLSKGTKELLLLDAVKRLLNSTYKNNAPMQNKIVTTLAATFSDVVRENILAHLILDMRKHIDIALGWLYEEYSIMQGFSRIPELRRTTRIEQSYNNLLTEFVKAASADSSTLTRLLLEAPIVTENSLEQLSAVCRNEQTCHWAFNLLRDLTTRRPTRQLIFLQAILVHTTHDNQTVRENAIQHILNLYKVPVLKETINSYVLKTIDYFVDAIPSEKISGLTQGRVKMEIWTDEVAKACLDMYMTLLPQNEEMIHHLAKVYIQTGADVKRTILRMLDSPIRSMGMNSSELLKLVEDCPKGSETLVTRVIHILTDKGLPSVQLVQRVRELYNTRVSDVRFLIPVLNGLSKNEVLAAMPKLIKLNPVVVREVFNRLLGAHGESSVSPIELLVALHLIDTNKADIKTKMKAITMCLTEKQVFTQEVLAVVLQQLMDQTPLPTLLMRTVIQGLGLYPRLSGFVMNILQRLILKQVWKQKVVWEGFVKCCQRTKPQSFGVLMQLPPAQLNDALAMCPELREPLKDNLLTFTDGQRSHIPSAVQEILIGSVAAVLPIPLPILPEIVPPPDITSGVTLLEPLPPGME